MEKKPFYLTKRKNSKNKNVWYYYTYNSDGTRSTPKSTGMTNKTDATNYCLKLFQHGSLNKSKVSFQEYASKVFDDNSSWYKERILNGNKKKNTVNSYRHYVKCYYIPYFGNTPLDSITTNDIKSFRVYLSEERGLCNRYINTIVTVLKMVFNYAVDEDYINRNPVSYSISNLKFDKNREAFTYDEIIYMLKRDIEDPINRKAWIICLTAAVTGMRIGEVLGLQEDQFKDGSIYIDRQIQDGELYSVKTSMNRFVTCPERLKNLLFGLEDRSYFIFMSSSKYGVPVTPCFARDKMATFFSEELKIKHKQRKVCFHSFRYFFNTYLLSNNINPVKVNFVIGHSMGNNHMQELYTTWKPEMYSEILECQERLLDDILGKV